MKKVLILFLLALVSCDMQRETELQIGVWGSEGAGLTIQEDSWYIELGCAHVTVQGTVILIDGQFEKSADYFQESGVFLDDPDFYKAQPGRVSGLLKENGDLEISIQARESLDDIGTYTFRFNREAKVYKCA